MKKVLFVGVFFSSILVFLGAGSSSITTTARSAAPVTAFMRAPLAFVPNQGQFDREALFNAVTPGYTLWLTAEGLVFDAGSASAGRSVSRLGFLGARHDARVTAEGPSSAVVNCYHGADPSRWRTGLPTSAAVRYAGIYPNIDLKVYGTGEAIEYDWIVNPGGDPSQIRFKYEEAEAVRISAEGDLVVRMPFGELRHRKPICSQEASGSSRVVKAEFMDLGGGEFGFGVGSYDHERPIIIDPLVLVFSTFIGGAKSDSVENIVVDSQGAVYGAGYTYSSDFPRKKAVDTNYAGSSEAILFKFDANGQLVFSTLLGGSDLERFYKGVAVSPDGSVWVAGRTDSTDFPTLKALDSTANGGGDVFVAHFKAGGVLESSTYLGGSEDDGGWDIAVDSDSSAVVTGYTKSADFPTKKAFDKKWNGDYDAFITKLDSTASSIVFSTFFGGRKYDDFRALAIDPGGSIYLAGATGSPDFTVLNAYDSTYNGGADDACAAKFSKSGSLIYSTYYGGGSRELPEDIAVDSKGGALIIGAASSINFPVKNAYQSKRAGSEDAYIIKFLPSGKGLEFSTYFGKSHTDLAISVCLDSKGAIWVGGTTYSSDFPLKDPWDAGFAGMSEGFLLRFSSSGTALEFSTFLGGNSYEWVKGLAFGTDGSLYVGGGTRSPDFKVKNAYNAKLKGEADGFIVKFKVSK
jgi:hypothetical protein